MKLKSALYTAVAAASLGFSVVAQAATWTPILDLTSPFVIDYEKGGKIKQANVYFNPSPASEIWYYNGNLTPQSPASIEAAVEDRFGTLVNFVGACDDEGCSTGSSASGFDDPAGSFSSGVGFNYLAIHFGQGELFFRWDDLITEFDIRGLPRGLSNFRAYSDISEVPAPAAAWLLGSALLGFVTYRRRSH